MDDRAETHVRPAPAPELSIDGPLSPDAARALLERGADLLASGDYADAAAHYRRVVGFDDPTITGAALLGLAEALYRLDNDDAALAAWEAALQLPENPNTYPAWRNVAAARVRSGDLQGAIKAYREADRRAPHEDKAEIASRLGWLAKETGDARASRRYFAASRGGPSFPLTWVIIGLTVVVSIAAMNAPSRYILEPLMLDKARVAAGEYWRLWTVTLVHDPTSLLHLVFNMYALYIVGPLVELLYGSRKFLLFYLLCAAAGSVASFVFGAGEAAVGASGAIFGLFGVLAAASRTHNPVLDRRGRALMGQIGMLILINLLIGFVVPGIDNAAHIGGLVAGAWLGFLFVPGRVRTLRSMWIQPGGTSGMPSASQGLILPTLGVAALVVVLAAGVAVGTDARKGPGAGRATTVSGQSQVLVATPTGDSATRDLPAVDLPAVDVPRAA